MLISCSHSSINVSYICIYIWDCRRCSAMFAVSHGSLPRFLCGLPPSQPFLSTCRTSSASFSESLIFALFGPASYLCCCCCCSSCPDTFQNLHKRKVIFLVFFGVFFPLWTDVVRLWWRWSKVVLMMGDWKGIGSLKRWLRLFSFSFFLFGKTGRWCSFIKLSELTLAY